ncbi:alpha/beta hydrolase [Exiguobacterium acetylicum]|uniref:alpha/beta hydrolase n=1 Tax=Exiguobacterium acetylicum TaxID=41170 RepID=UPI0038768380
MWKKHRKKIIGGVIVIVTLAVIVVIGISGYVGSSLTQPEREALTTTPKKAEGLDYEDVTFRSYKDRTRLSGWWMPSEDAKLTVVFAHGYGKNREQEDVPIFPLFKKFHDAGYNVLTFDFRGSGESDGKRVTVGAKEQDDLLTAVRYAKSRSSKPVVLYGISMGAATSLVTAPKADVIGVIADSPFSDLENYLATNLPVWSGLPNFPFTPIILEITPPLTGLNPERVKPIEAVRRIEYPILLIHGKDDDAIPVTESMKIQKAAPRSELYVTENGGHVQSYAHDRKAYEEKVMTYLSDLH